MLTGIKQKANVGKNGKIELPTTDLAEGTIVEDETTYLFQSEVNKQCLLKARENVEKRNLI